MKAPSLDKPLKLTPDFLAAFAVLAVPTLWLAQPWSWNLPLISKVAGVDFLPFAAVIVCYCPVLLALAVIHGGKEEERAQARVVGAVAGAAVFLSESGLFTGSTSCRLSLPFPQFLSRAGSIPDQNQVTLTSRYRQRL